MSFGKSCVRSGKSETNAATDADLRLTACIRPDRLVRTVTETEDATT